MAKTECKIGELLLDHNIVVLIIWLKGAALVGAFVNVPIFVNAVMFVKEIAGRKMLIKGGTYLADGSAEWCR